MTSPNVHGVEYELTKPRLSRPFGSPSRWRMRKVKVAVGVHVGL
jgi:hypothetical protein